VRAKALDAGAGAWLAALPELVGGLARRWGLRVGDAFGDATEAYVVSVTRDDGTPAVLKILVPRGGDVAAHEIAVLRLAGGRGCCRLLDYDLACGALLLERLGTPMSELDIPQPRRLEILCDLAAAVWRTVPGGSRGAAENGGTAPGADGYKVWSSGAVGDGQMPRPEVSGRGEADFTIADLPSGLAKAEWLAARIPRRWTELGEPCSRRTITHALAAAQSRRRAHDPDRAVLVHGDVHQWNALRAGDGFKLVDPDGLFAEPEYDLGVLMREDPVELLAGDPWERARWLAGRTGTDPVAIWEWGVAERVSTGLLLTAIGLQPVAAQMLATADAVSAAG